MCRTFAVDLRCLSVATSIDQRFKWLSRTSSACRGRPLEARRKRRLRQLDRARLAESGLVIDHELLLAARVGEPRERAPSGDHAGFSRSCPAICDRFRQSPLSVGTVKMSPRASNAARTPVGDSDASRIMPSTRLNCARAHGKSPTTSISSRLTGRSSHRPGDVAGLFVDDRVSARRRVHDVEVIVMGDLFHLLRVRLYEKRFAVPARSERKYTVFPIHIGSWSLLFFHGSFSTE